MPRPQPSFLVGRSVAITRQTHHQFVEGLGYVAHSGPPELPPGCNGSANCAPPKGAGDGSLHLLKPPGGHPPLTMRWVAREGAWASLHPGWGNRLAWPTAHLSKAGWAYVGVAPPEAE